MNESLLFLIIALGMLGFGLVAVFSVLALREQWKHKKEPGRAAEVLPTPVTGEGAVEVLRLYRERLTGELMVEIDGRRYGRREQIRDAAVWRGLAAAHKDLTQWMQGNPPVPPAESPHAPAPTVTPTPVSGLSPSDVPPPNMNPFQQMKILRERGKTASASGPKSVVEQIDEILQRRLAGTPYAASGVRMQSLPSGGVQILVGREPFEGIDSVPDPEIRALIRESVKEWEAKG